ARRTRFFPAVMMLPSGSAGSWDGPPGAQTERRGGAGPAGGLLGGKDPPGPSVPGRPGGGEPTRRARAAVPGARGGAPDGGGRAAGHVAALGDVTGDTGEPAGASGEGDPYLPQARRELPRAGEGGEQLGAVRGENRCPAGDRAPVRARVDDDAVDSPPPGP